MNVNILSSSAAVLLSLVLAYVPGLAPRFDKLSSASKSLVVAICLLLIAAGSQVMACTPQLAAFVPDLDCTPLSVGGTISAFIAALVANQGTYVLAVQGKK